MEDLAEFWPPRCYEDATKTLDEHSFIKFNIIPFTFNSLEFASFEAQTRQSRGKMPGSKKHLRCEIVPQTTDL